LESRMRALVGAIHEVLVGPFEIEGVVQSLAKPRVGELLPPRIEEPALRTRGRLVGDQFLLHAAVANGGEVVTGRPDARDELLAEQEVLCFKTFESDIAVAIELVAHRIEIMLADAHRQGGAPPAGNTLILDVAAHFEAADPVGSRAEWNVKR